MVTMTRGLRLWRLMTSALVVAMASFEIGYQEWKALPSDHREQADLVSIYQKRLSGVRQKLLEHHVPGQVGYCFYRPWGDARLADYFASQYVLAPIVLDRHFLNCDWTVVDLRTNPQAPLPPMCTMVDDCGNGVFLVKKDVR
jgi:hypothetical protein